MESSDPLVLHRRVLKSAFGVATHGAAIKKVLTGASTGDLALVKEGAEFLAEAFGKDLPPLPEGSHESAAYFSYSAVINGVDEEDFNSTAMHKAAAGGFVDVARYLASMGCDATIPDATGVLPIHLAASCTEATSPHYLDTLKFFCEDLVEKEEGEEAAVTSTCSTRTTAIRRLPSVDATHNGWTALHYAIHYANVDASLYLINVAKANVNAANIAADGKTPLHFCISASGGDDKIPRRLAILEAVLRSGRCDVNALSAVNGEGSRGVTALHLAAQNSKLTGMLKMLVTLGNDTRYFRPPAVLLAAPPGEAAAPPFEVIDVSKGDGKGHPPIFNAISQGLLEHVKYFIEDCGVSKHIRGSLNTSLLHAVAIPFSAVFGGPMAPTAAIANAYAWLEEKQNAGEGEMCYPSKGTDPLLSYVVETLNVDDPNPKDSMGNTPLHYAIMDSRPERIPYLIAAAKCCPNVACNKGMTALLVHYAVGWDVPLPYIDFMVQKGGADLYAMDDHGQTALHFAAAKGFTHIVKYFLTGVLPSAPPAPKPFSFGSSAAPNAQFSFNFDFSLSSSAAPAPTAEASPQTASPKVSESITVNTTANNNVNTSGAIRYTNVDLPSHPAGMTPLFFAAGYGMLDTVKYLVTEAKTRTVLPSSDDKLVGANSEAPPSTAASNSNASPSHDDGAKESGATVKKDGDSHDSDFEDVADEREEDAANEEGKSAAVIARGAQCVLTYAAISGREEVVTFLLSVVDPETVEQFHATMDVIAETLGKKRVSRRGSNKGHAGRKVVRKRK